MKNEQQIASPTQAVKRSLGELSLLFLRLGSTSFGGPAVHIAMMEDEVVTRRGWLTREQFLDMIAATNFIPGPNSTEMAIHVGYMRAGFKGLLTAGISFIAPAVLIVSILAWGYQRFGALPISAGFLYGIKPVVIAVVAQALWRLGKSALKNKFLIGLAILAALANFLGLGELTTLFVAAIVSGLQAIPDKFGRPFALFCLPTLPSFSFKPALYSISSALAAVPILVSIQLWQLFFVFLKIGSVLFGSGYVLLAFLRSDLVERLAWLSEAQLLDAVAIGQVTPGPLFTTATFIGYILSGPSGAMVATLGIFLPAFFFVALSAPLLPYLRRSPVASNVLDGLNVASLALMAVVALHLAQYVIFDWKTLLLALLSVALLIRTGINSAWLILAGGILGCLIKA